ncbi:GNAT family N-acetyltransferase [Hoyosella sp. YIM 151337]|uniref:GNAT family N-acetyltransferase n=1 Tax=Hoyosella sp. YIM 151337 TaxID=2992742 RepID=UPI0022358A9B|nr:GNAT family N-acetyltransferase [Hoyosella sp. YIM 151337]MCW4353029.1 GNAT family N-acetyltransferase [Hoyosella sp. YIM 151337]
MIAYGEPAEVAALRWEWAQEWHPTAGTGPDDGFVSSVARWMEGERTVWTAHNTDGAVGMVCLTQFERMPSPVAKAEGSWGYLGHLYVRPSARREGIGTALVEQVLTEAANRRYSKVVLTASEMSVSFYVRRGFSNVRGLLLWTPKHQ